MEDYKELTLFLNRVLSNYFVLYVKLHRYTWFTEGEHIFQLQYIYKEMYEEIKKDIHKIVDHILSINGIPYATMIKFIKEATIEEATDRKSTRLNSSHVAISYAVFCLKKKKK